MLPLLRTALAVTALAAALSAAALTPLPPLADSQQAIVVVTDDWDASQGRLQAYERKGTDGAWRPHGPAFTDHDAFVDPADAAALQLCDQLRLRLNGLGHHHKEIGRASCRERV